jgi:hypothetical protein
MLASGKNAQPADNISQLLVCDKLKSRSIIPLRQMATNGLQKKCITVCSLKQMTYGANHPPFKALVVGSSLVNSVSLFSSFSHG